MRMARCWPSLILLLYAFSAHANASTTLSSELTNFVPQCAQECFISFIDANFSPFDCSSTPTLDCLCTHNSTSGYTVGEGAVQCIISEDRVGFCKGVNASDQVVLSAYTMCDGVDNALPETHSTIVATLVVQSSAPSIVLVSPGTTTTAAAPSSTLSTSNQPTSSSTTSTSSSAASSSSNAGVLPSSSLALFPTSSQSLPATSATATPTPTSGLSKPQVVGITVASVGVGALALSLVLLYACWKRRRARKDRDSDLFPFTPDPSFDNYTKYAQSTTSRKSRFGFSPFRPAGRRELGPGATANGVAAKIAPPVPPRLDTQTPNMFSRRSIRPDTIGVAISPENTMHRQRTPIKRQRTSKLLPDKPLLRLQMPTKAASTLGVEPSGLSFSQPATTANGLRQSTATQFEEDEETATTGGVRDTWGRADVDEQDSRNLRTLRAVNPDPPEQAYVGHWRPQVQNPTDMPDYYIQPLSLNRKVGSFSQPRRPEEYPRPVARQQGSPLDAFPAPPAHPQPPRLKIPSQGPVTATSSVYSARTTSLPATDPSPTSRQRKKYKPVGPYDAHKSSGSMTSFETTSPTTPTKTPRTAGSENPLSPVVESPASGKSPVSYPKIPKAGAGRLPESTIRMVPPPPQPDFRSAMMAAEGESIKPWRVAELEAARRRRDEEVQSQEQPLYQAQTQTQQRRNSLLELQLPERTTSRSYHNAAIPPSQRGNFQPPPLLRGQLQRPGMIVPRSKFAQRPNNEPQLPINFPRSSSALSHISEDSSNASSIAQRRGVAPPTLNNDTTKSNKWRVLKDGDKAAAKDPGWRPMLNSGERREGQEPAELPGTPGWVPRLTPTRRGDELFISVQ